MFEDEMWEEEELPDEAYINDDFEEEFYEEFFPEAFDEEEEDWEVDEG